MRGLPMARTGPQKSRECVDGPELHRSRAPLLGVGYRSSSETRTQQPSRTATTWAQNDFLSWRKTSVQDFWRGIVKSEGLTKATICTFIAHLEVDFTFSPQVFFSPPIDSESADRCWPHRLTSSGRSWWIFWRSEQDEQDRENPMPTIQRWATYDPYKWSYNSPDNSNING